MKKNAIFLFFLLTLLINFQSLAALDDPNNTIGAADCKNVSSETYRSVTNTFDFSADIMTDNEMNAFVHDNTVVRAPVNSNTPPTAEDQNFCTGYTVGSLQATGSDLKWYSAEVGGTALETIAVLTTSMYYVSQTVSGVESNRTAVNVTVDSGTSICGNVINNVFTLKLPSAGSNITDLHSSVDENILTLTIIGDQENLVLSSNTVGITKDDTANLKINLSEFSTFAGLAIEGNSGTDLITIGLGGIDFSALPGVDNQLIKINLNGAADKLTLSNSIKAKGTGEIYLQSGAGLEIDATLDTQGDILIFAAGNISNKFAVNNSSGSGDISISTSNGSITIKGGGIQTKRKVTLSATSNISITESGINNTAGSGDILISTSSGSITTGGEGVFSAGKVTLSATTGISITGKGINNTASSSSKDISISTSGGSITTGGFGLFSAGKVTLSGTEDILITDTGIDNRAGSGDISISTSNGKITTTSVIYSSGIVTLSGTKDISIISERLGGTGIDNRAGSGDISISTSNGKITITSVIYSKGAVILNAAGAILLSQINNTGVSGDISISTSGGSITSTFGISAKGDIVLNADGFILSSGGGLNNSNGTGDISITTSSGSINVSEGGVISAGKVTLSATGDITTEDNGINNTASSSMGDISISSSNGSITQPNGGINSKGAVILNATSFILLNGGGLNNSTGTGDISATSSGAAVTIDGGGILSSGVITIEADVINLRANIYSDTNDVNLKPVTDEMSIEQGAEDASGILRLWTTEPRSITAGAINLGSGLALEIQAIPSSLALGDKILLIGNLGSAAITSTFKDLPEEEIFDVLDENSNRVFFKISYLGGDDAHDLVLETVSNPAVTFTNQSNDNQWDSAANWSSGSVPTSSTYTEIPSNQDITINASTAAIVYNLSIDASASLTIADGGSLIVSGTKSSGIIKYNRTIDTKNWYLVSSPFVGGTIENLITNHTFAAGSASNIGLSTYDSANDTWSYFTPASTGPINTATGYAIKLAADGDISFSGTMNMDDTNTTLTTAGSGFNLIGNPYPSYINSGAILPNSTSALSSQTLWVWDKANDRYDTKVTDDAFKIAPGQAFFVKSNGASGNILINQDDQSHEILDTFQKTATRTEVHLTLSNASNSREAKIYYLENTTTGFDNGYDGPMFGGVANEFAIYTHAVETGKGENLATQSLPNSNFENMIIPVGINAASNIEITFTAKATALPEGVNVYLEDRFTNTFTQLDQANANYKVTLSEALKGVGRFFLHTSSKSTLGTNTVALDNINIYKTNNSTLRIVGLSRGKSNLKMFNILGQQILNSTFTSTGVQDISLPKVAAGVYIFQLETAAGKLNKKITLE